MSNKRMIYLDYHATTPTDPKVISAMLPYYRDKFANPSSSMHQAGKEAAKAVEGARSNISKLLGAEQSEIIFTSGATESNNLAIRGVSRANVDIGSRNQIVTTPIEHKSVLMPAKELKKDGYEIRFLPVDPNGQVDIDEASNVIGKNTFLVSVQAANNEIGSIQPIAKLSRIAHDKGALIHTDAAQVIGKTPFNVEDLEVDLLSMSAHKLYGPKGIGALYIRGGPHSLPIESLILGGGQESELRSGTLNVPAIVGLGKACLICIDLMETERHQTESLRDRLENKIMGSIDNVWRNGAMDNRLPGNSSLTFPGIDAEVLINHVPELALSTGSACASGAPEPSHVLTTIGLSRGQAYSTLRVGIGRFTTEHEIDRASELIIDAVNRLRTK